MRTITTTVYLFSELSEQAKKKAIQECWDYNVSHNWWEDIYKDAERIGLKISGFDIDQRGNIQGKLTASLFECCDLIHKEHGEECSTYKIATDYMKQWSDLVTKHSDGINTDKVAEGNEADFDNEADELESDFLKALCTDYLVMLRNEYEHQTSDEAIVETIEANGYEFNEDGTRA